jgi:hypothetical protein
LARSKSPSRKDSNNKDPPKKFGNTLAPNNLTATYLTATVGNPMQEGQLRAGFVPNATDNEDDGEKGGKKKEKYILRHLASGRIMYVSDVQRAV